MSATKHSEPVWRSPTGEVVSCVEKLKVLRENLEEIRQACQDALAFENPFRAKPKK